MIGSHNTTTTTPAYGATGADSTYATTAPHGTTTTTTTAPGHKGGLASKIPGTDAYKAAHGQAQHVEPGCAGQPTQVVEPGHVNTTTTGGYHGHHSTHDTKHHHSVTQTTAVPGQPGTTVTTTTTTPKVSTGEKISGKMDVLMGKATHNPAKVAHGEILQAEGKKGLDNAAIAYAQQAGHTTRH
ncbi:hypothetical protein JCM10212_005717 [Sporobolomyces blumeae]